MKEKEKKVSAFDFERLIKALNPRHFEYDTTYQETHDDLGDGNYTLSGKNFVVKGVYDEIMVFWQEPKVIFFKTKDGNNKLTFNGVEHVLIPADLNSAHIILEFTIVCKDIHGKEKQYILLADEMTIDSKSIRLVASQF